MPHITVSDATYARLQAWAKGRNTTIEQVVEPLLESLLPGTVNSPDPGTPDQELDQLVTQIRSLTKQVPSGHTVDDSRETLYAGRGG